MIDLPTALPQTQKLFSFHVILKRKLFIVSSVSHAVYINIYIPYKTYIEKLATSFSEWLDERTTADT